MKYFAAAICVLLAVSPAFAAGLADGNYSGPSTGSCPGENPSHLTFEAGTLTYHLSPQAKALVFSKTGDVQGTVSGDGSFKLHFGNTVYGAHLAADVAGNINGGQISGVLQIKADQPCSSTFSAQLQSQ